MLLNKWFKREGWRGFIGGHYTAQGLSSTAHDRLEAR